MKENKKPVGFEHEWEILHHDNEKYERYSLMIKLTAIIIAVLLLISDVHFILSVIAICTLWGQEAIWKTFQTRLCDRLMLVEQVLNLKSEKTADKKSDKLPTAFQLYSQWMENKPSTSGLIVDYIRHGLKPTVIYPYAILLFIVLLF